MALHAEDRSLVFVNVEILFVSKEFESVNDAEDTHKQKSFRKSRSKLVPAGGVHFPPVDAN